MSSRRGSLPPWSDVYTPIIKPFKNNVLVMGDAASCQELECLGAMITGWKGGLAVAAALKEFQLGVAPRAIDDYCDWWLNTYIKMYDYQGYLEVFGVAYMFKKPEYYRLYLRAFEGDRSRRPLIPTPRCG